MLNFQMVFQTLWIQIPLTFHYIPVSVRKVSKNKPPIFWWLQSNPVLIKLGMVCCCFTDTKPNAIDLSFEDFFYKPFYYFYCLWTNKHFIQFIFFNHLSNSFSDIEIHGMVYDLFDSPCDWDLNSAKTLRESSKFLWSFPAPWSWWHQRVSRGFIEI